MSAPIAADMDRSAFVERFGGVVEYSPWVAEAAYESAPFADLTALHSAFEEALLAAPADAQLAVLRAHPDLAVQQRGPQHLTEESASEQAGAGLDRLGDNARIDLATMLTAYRERYGFPFIVCVRDHGGAGLPELVDSRLGSPPEQELAVSLAEVSSIARHRLADLVREHHA